jgi:gliding motility-associated-like protein
MIINITTQVKPTFTQLGPLCQNSVAPVLPATSKEGVAGSWNPAVISTSALGTVTYTFTPSGSSCSVPATMAITVSTQVTPGFAAIGPLCQNAPAPILATTSTNNISGTWSPAVVNTATVGTTSYTFTPSTGQCGTTAKTDIVVNALPVVKTGSDQTITAGESTPLSATITGVSEDQISQYLWSPSTGLSNAGIVNPAASPASTTTYRLDVTSDAGCTGSGSTTITVNASVLPPIQVPNVFSPNGDGINDTWVITNLSYYTEATVNVYNRYGQSVFQSQGDYKAWDGNFNGKQVPFGTYYYIIDLKNNTKKKAGSITILR